MSEDEQRKAADDEVEAHLRARKNDEPEDEMRKGAREEDDGEDEVEGHLRAR